MNLGAFLVSSQSMEKTIYNPDYESLINWLKTARKSSGLTMRDLCKLLDCSIGHVQKIESGYHRLDALQLVRYCEAIEADVHEGIRILQKKGRPYLANPLHSGHIKNPPQYDFNVPETSIQKTQRVDKSPDPKKHTEGL